MKKNYIMLLCVAIVALSSCLPPPDAFEEPINETELSNETISIELINSQNYLWSSPLAETHPIENLWDGFIDNNPDHKAGSPNHDSFTVIFDFKSIHTLTNISFYPDLDGAWITSNLTLELSNGSEWIVHAEENINVETWLNFGMGKARYVRLTATSYTGQVEAREFSVKGYDTGELGEELAMIIENQSPEASDLLFWKPPVLDNPITITVTTQSTINMDATKDYIIKMPDVPVRRGLALVGGRNVVMIGGEIFIPYQGENPTIQSRRALYIADNKGIVHIEGILMHGDDISEGIQTKAPDSIIQLQNIGVYGIHARDQVGFTDNHPDIVQTWGSVKELRIDKLSGTTDYQGLLFKSDYNGPHGPVHLRRVSIEGDSTSRYLFWTSGQGGSYPTITLHNVYIKQALSRPFGKSIWPDIDNNEHRLIIGQDDVGNYGAWNTLPVTGRIYQSVPLEGHFVKETDVGLNYISPGYV